MEEDFLLQGPWGSQGPSSRSELLEQELVGV